MRKLIGVPVLFLGLGCVGTDKAPVACTNCWQGSYYMTPGKVPATNGVMTAQLTRTSVQPGYPEAAPKGRRVLGLDWTHIPVPVPKLLTVPEQSMVYTGQPQAFVPNVVYHMPAATGTMPVAASLAAQSVQPVVPTAATPAPPPAILHDINPPQYLPAPTTPAQSDPTGSQSREQGSLDGSYQRQ